MEDRENFREREFGTDCPHDSGDAGQYSPLCSLPIIDMGIYYCGYITCGMDTFICRRECGRSIFSGLLCLSLPDR